MLRHRLAVVVLALSMFVCGESSAFVFTPAAIGAIIVSGTSLVTLVSSQVKKIYMLLKGQSVIPEREALLQDVKQFSSQIFSPAGALSYEIAGEEKGVDAKKSVAPYPAGLLAIVPSRLKPTKEMVKRWTRLNIALKALGASAYEKKGVGGGLSREQMSIYLVLIEKYIEKYFDILAMVQEQKKPNDQDFSVKDGADELGVLSEIVTGLKDQIAQDLKKAWKWTAARNVRVALQGFDELMKQFDGAARKMQRILALYPGGDRVVRFTPEPEGGQEKFDGGEV